MKAQATPFLIATKVSLSLSLRICTLNPSFFPYTLRATPPTSSLYDTVRLQLAVLLVAVRISADMLDTIARRNLYLSLSQAKPEKAGKPSRAFVFSWSKGTPYASLAPAALLSLAVIDAALPHEIVYCGE
jgi:hypothetical protein